MLIKFHIVNWIVRKNLSMIRRITKIVAKDIIIRYVTIVN